MHRLKILLGFISGFVLLLGWMLANADDYPDWWYQRNLINSDAPSDYYTVNQGQAKYTATLALEEFEEELFGGPSAALTNRIGSLANTNNYNLLNLGQLKYLAEPFYDELTDIGFVDSAPWVGQTSTSDYAIANLGQLKYIFSFDLANWNQEDEDGDGLSNYDETVHGTDVDDTDSDNDGVSDLDEVIAGTDPNDDQDTPGPTSLFLEVYTPLE